mgnify:CR=1 FL=1
MLYLYSRLFSTVTKIKQNGQCSLSVILSSLKLITFNCSIKASVLSELSYKVDHSVNVFACRSCFPLLNSVDDEWFTGR